MKNRKRKNRDWDKDCYIMRKFGGGIRMEIERTFRRAAANQIKHGMVKVVDDAVRLPEGAYKDVSEKVAWILT